MTEIALDTSKSRIMEPIGVIMSASQGRPCFRTSCGITSLDAVFRHMKHKAGNLGVDLLLVDTGTHWDSLKRVQLQFSGKD